MKEKLTWEINQLYPSKKVTISSPSSELLKKLTLIGDLQIIPDPDLQGLRMVVSLKNGFDISIIKRKGSYGFKYDAWELAVLKDGFLNYNTDITPDVLAFLSDEQVAEAVEIANEMDENGKLPEGISIDSIYDFEN